MNSSELQKGTKYHYHFNPQKPDDKVTVTFVEMKSSKAIVKDVTGKEWAVYPEQLETI